jgi:hypothetical protein
MLTYDFVRFKIEKHYNKTKSKYMSKCMAGFWLFGDDKTEQWFREISKI